MLSKKASNELENGFNLDDFIEKNKIPLVLLLIGIILVGLGLIIFKKDVFNSSSNKIEVLEDADKTDKSNENNNETGSLIVEVAGAVEKPGVYKFKSGDRVDDALIAAGGLSADCDRIWVEKYVNRAAKLVDGQKLYLPTKNEHSDVLSAKDSGVYQNDTSSYSNKTEGKTNINTASLKKLDSLPGIGPVYGNNIIEQRPYSNIEELLTKDVIPKKTYEKIKDRISVY